MLVKDPRSAGAADEEELCTEDCTCSYCADATMSDDPDDLPVHPAEYSARISHSLDRWHGGPMGYGKQPCVPAPPHLAPPPGHAEDLRDEQHELG